MHIRDLRLSTMGIVNAPKEESGALGFFHQEDSCAYLKVSGFLPAQFLFDYWIEAALAPFSEGKISFASGSP